MISYLCEHQTAYERNLFTNKNNLFKKLSLINI